MDCLAAGQRLPSAVSAVSQKTLLPPQVPISPPVKRPPFRNTVVPRLPWSSGERSEFHGGRVQRKTDGQPRNKHGAANASGAAGGERSAELRGDVFGRAAGLAAKQRRAGRARGHGPRAQAARRVGREPGHQRRAGPFRFRPGGHARQPAAFSVSLGLFARGHGAAGGAFSFRRGGGIAGGARHAIRDGGHQFRQSPPAAG